MPVSAVHSTPVPILLLYTPNLTMGENEIPLLLCWYKMEAEICSIIYNLLSLSFIHDMV